MTLGGTTTSPTPGPAVGTPSLVTTAACNALRSRHFPWELEGSNMSHDDVNMNARSVGPHGNTHRLSNPPQKEPGTKVTSATDFPLARVHTCEGRGSLSRSLRLHATSHAYVYHLQCCCLAIGFHLLQPGLYRSHRSFVTAHQP